MKCIKMLPLLTIAAAVLMTVASTAAATITSPTGTPFTGNLHLSASNSELDGTVDVKCKNTTTTVSFANGSTTGTVTSYSTTECSNDTYTAVRLGTLSISSSGAVTSAGAEVTAQVHRSVFGFPITTHCIYATGAGTTVGSLTEGVSPAVVHLMGTDLPREATDSACGENSQWTGTYTATEPAGAITVD